jgi:predicted nucleotide-binding protein
MKPKIFIGSSAESLSIAYSVQENLEHHSECTVWSQGIFNLSESTLDSLIKSLEGFDFGIFVVGPEDILKLRGEEFKAARDNVIFELGLFIGKLGKSRNFILVPRGAENFHLPTDLIGLNPADYEPNRVMQTSMRL